MPLCTSSFIAIALVPAGSRARAAATTASMRASCACRSAFAAFRALSDTLERGAVVSTGAEGVEGGDGGGEVMVEGGGGGGEVMCCWMKGRRMKRRCRGRW
jgi:hypothetical protein